MKSVPTRFSIRILADDLSGAADCAAAFTGAVGAISLLLRGEGRGETRFALDADTRVLDANAAAARWHAIGQAGAADRRSVTYKKIDSTLRGNIAEELCALLEELPHVGTVVIAPAFPAQGRTIVNGQLWVRGEATGKSIGRLAEAVRVAGLPHSLLLADATEQGDLEALVASVGRDDPNTLWVGSAGLARALAGTPPSTVDHAELEGPLLIVAGSYSPVTVAQVQAFAAVHPRSLVAFAPADDPSIAAARAMAAMQATGAALVHVNADAPPAEGSREIVARLAPALRNVARRCATLVMTGGDTARAMFEALDVQEVFIEGELAAGIAVSAPVEPYRFRAVLKAGGFGDNDTFLRLHPPVSPP
ncbi:MAG TPA: four-carbon acid sugar kinase family protein [Usitatibacter sp.]|nr:four-carbon acid sugar kinase family protein [Usitatibacter sp.]